jgi:hypothetical protein
VKTSKVSLLIIGAVALLTFRVSAVEYVTLNPSSRSVELAKADLVEIVGIGDVNSYGVSIKLSPDIGSPVFLAAQLGMRYSGMLAVEVQGNEDFLTLKITRAHEINAVQPTSVLVIPENATGNYDIVVETSDDTSTWTPFHSQTVSATDAKRFFRTRIVKRD